MHSTNFYYDGKTYTVYHNSDYSDDVVIPVNIEKIVQGSKDMLIIEFPFDVLRKLVLDYLRNKKVEQLNSYDHDTLEKSMLGLWSS